MNKKMDGLELITKRARRFKPLWRDHNYNGAFYLCNAIRREDDVPEYSLAKFEEGYQYRVIFHEDWKEAKSEFINLVFGWW